MKKKHTHAPTRIIPYSSCCCCFFFFFHGKTNDIRREKTHTHNYAGANNGIHRGVYIVVERVHILFNKKSLGALSLTVVRSLFNVKTPFFFVGLIKQLFTCPGSNTRVTRHTHWRDTTRATISHSAHCGRGKRRHVATCISLLFPLLLSFITPLYNHATDFAHSPQRVVGKWRQITRSPLSYIIIEGYNNCLIN